MPPFVRPTGPVGPIFPVTPCIPVGPVGPVPNTDIVCRPQPNGTGSGLSLVLDVSQLASISLYLRKAVY